MANPEGNAASLVPQYGNTHNARHGAYNPRLREGRARKVAAEIMAADRSGSTPAAYILDAHYELSAVTFGAVGLSSA